MPKFPPLTKDEKRAFSLAKKNKERCENPIKGKWRLKFDELEKVFEELLVEQFAISELRDIWRKKAGLPTKCIDSEDVS